MTTVQEGHDVRTAPLLVVRTRVLLMPVEDMLAALIAALIDHPSMADLRDEQRAPELVLDVKPAADLAEAQVLAKAMAAGRTEVPERQRVKIVQPSARYLAEAEQLAKIKGAERPEVPRTFRLTVCEECGTFGAPDATHCLVCTGQCGGPCCTTAGPFPELLGGAR